MPTHAGIAQEAEMPAGDPWASSRILCPSLTLFPAESFFPSLPPERQGLEQSLDSGPQPLSQSFCISELHIKFCLGKKGLWLNVLENID